MFGVTLSEAVASGTTISGDWGSCATKQWQDLTHRGAVFWSAKDRSASAQKLKQFSMPVHSVMLVQNTIKQYGAKHFKSFHGRIRFHLGQISGYRKILNHLNRFFFYCAYFFIKNVKVIRMKTVERIKVVIKEQFNKWTECLQIWEDRVAVWIWVYESTRAELSGWFYHLCLKHHQTHGTHEHKHRKDKSKRS